MPSAAPIILALATLLLAGQAAKANETCAAAAPPTHRVVAIHPWPDGTARPTVTLSQVLPDPGPAVPVVLDGILLPAKADVTTRKGFSAMTAELEGGLVALLPSGDAPDRHGRQRAILQLAGGGNLGETIIAAGFGVTDVSFAPCADRFLAAETKARAEKRGIWRQSRIWTDLNAAATSLPDFVLGRGRVASIGRSGHTTYINFGGNFRTDATVRLREALTLALAAAGRPPETLPGRVVEVRGWASRRDGLDLELQSPLALQLPDEAVDTGTD